MSKTDTLVKPPQSTWTDLGSIT